MGVFNDNFPSLSKPSFYFSSKKLFITTLSLLILFIAYTYLYYSGPLDFNRRKAAEYLNNIPKYPEAEDMNCYDWHTYWSGATCNFSTSNRTPHEILEYYSKNVPKVWVLELRSEEPVTNFLTLDYALSENLGGSFDLTVRINKSDHTNFESKAIGKYDVSVDIAHNPYGSSSK